MITSFNQKRVDALKYTGKEQRIRVGEKLYVVTRATGNRYYCRFTEKGKTHSKILGLCSDISLKDARAMVHTIQYAAPVPTALSFKELACDYMAESERAGKALIESRIAIINKRFSKVSIHDISRLDIVEFIRAYRSRSKSMSDQLLILFRTILSHGVATGVLSDNVAIGIPRSTAGYKLKARTRTLSNDEIIWLWNQESTNGRIAKFLLLTGLRVTEALTGYVDGDKFRCIAKGDREHWIYLTPTAKELLPFPQGRDGNVVSTWLRRHQSEKESRFTPHDCRRTYATLANDNGIQPFIVERCLNHKLTGMMGVYNLAEYEAERREAAEVVERVVLKIANSLPSFLN